MNRLTDAPKREAVLSANSTVGNASMADAQRIAKLAMTQGGHYLDQPRSFEKTSGSLPSPRDCPGPPGLFNPVCEAWTHPRPGRCTPSRRILS